MFQKVSPVCPASKNSQKIFAFLYWLILAAFHLTHWFVTVRVYYEYSNILNNVLEFVLCLCKKKSVTEVHLVNIPSNSQFAEESDYVFTYALLSFTLCELYVASTLLLG